MTGFQVIIHACQASIYGLVIFICSSNNKSLFCQRNRFFFLTASVTLFIVPSSRRVLVFVHFQFAALIRFRGIVINIFSFVLKRLSFSKFGEIWDRLCC